MPRFPLVAAAAVSLAFAAPAFAVDAPPVQTIDVQSFSFSPKPIHLAAGKPVTLNFINRSGSSHDFTAPQFFAYSTFSVGTAPNGEIDLPPHATRSVTLTPRAGTYNAHCSHFLHSAMGMHVQIIVD